MTMGISQIFTRGLDGLNVNQRGMAATANNIANVNTKGYARQEIVIATNANFGGAQVTGVRTIVSPFVELQLFTSANDFGTVDGRRQMVAKVEEMFNEARGDGLGKAISEFFNSWSALSVDAASSVNRQTVKDAGIRLATKFNYLSRQINQMRGDASAEVTTRVDSINDLATQIANLNSQIQANPTSEMNSDLKTQRTQLLRQLSEEVNVTYFEQDDLVNVSINGSASLVTGTQAGTLSMTNDTSEGGTMAISITLPGSGTSQDITNQISGGRLGGNLIERNDSLNDRLAELDELAYNITNQINSLHSTGYGLNGATNINFFQALASQGGAARSIQIDSQIESDLQNIAAAEQDPAVSGVADNGMALDLADLANALTMDSGTQTFSQYYQEVVGTVGSASKSVIRDYETQQNLVNQLELQREGISGVNMDEEGANIIRFQRAFQASSRLLMVADELLKTLIQM